MKMLTITDSAAKQIKSIVGDGAAVIRLNVKRGGCFGFTYDLSKFEGSYEGLRALEDNGVKILMTNETFASVVGLTVDFEGGFNGKGFVYDNPSATACCHCGISFSNR